MKIFTIFKKFLSRKIPSSKYDVTTAKGLRLFAVECAKRAQTYPKNYVPDPRSLKAIEVAERFANGEATEKELNEAHTAAYSVVETIFTAAIAAYATAADDATYSAAYAAYVAAAADATEAAKAAAKAAAYSVAASADDGDGDAAAAASDGAAYAVNAERKKQVETLIEMFK